MRLQISEHELNAATKAAIRYLVHEADMSQTEIGERLGYPDGGMVGKALRGDAALGPVKLVNLARLASAHGHTDLSELFSAPSYACVPALEGQADDRWEANRRVVEEVAGVTLGAGSLHAAVEGGDLSRARRWWNVGLTWWRRCRAELDEIAERGWPGRFGVSAQSGGDGLPEAAAAPAVLQPDTTISLDREPHSHAPHPAMPDDAEMHTPAPWTDEADDPNLVCVKKRGEGLPPVLFALAATFEADEADTTAEENARRIVACVNFCKGTSTADLEESLERGDTLADSDEAIVARLNEVGEERNDLRDENERLKERVAELESALADADQVIGVLKGAAAFLNAEGEKKGMPAAGNYRFWSKQCEEKKEMLEAAPLPDTDAAQNASREAEVGHE